MVFITTPVILLCIIFLGYNNSDAQQYQLEPANSVSGALTLGPYLQTIGIKIDIINLEPVNLKLKWKIVEKQLNPLWSYSVCDHDYCWSGTLPDSANLSSISVNDTGFLKLSVVSDTVPGTGLLKMLLHGISAADTLTFNVEFILGIEDHGDRRLIEMSPGNSASYLILNVRDPEYSRRPVQLGIYNSIGKKVHNFTANYGTSVISIEHLSTGIYFLRIENGTVPGVFRFSKI